MSYEEYEKYIVSRKGKKNPKTGKTITWQELADEVNDKFAKQYSWNTIRTKWQRLKNKEEHHKKFGGSMKTKLTKDNVKENFTDELHSFLRTRKQTLTLEELSDHFNCGISKIKDSMEKLAKAGSNIQIVSAGVELSRDIPKSEATVINIDKLKGRTIRFGLTSDNHLGSKYCRLDVLNALYDIWEREGIRDVYQCGNMIDGEARFNKFDLIAHGVEGQATFFAENWPKRKGMHMYFVTGDDHEGWYIQREGIVIGKYLEDKARELKRSDLHYLGHMEHDIVYRGTRQRAVMRLIHAGGGSAYATSYAPQKIVESYQGGEKPNILLVGHFHKSEYGYPREIHVVQAGCTEDQTPFMRKKRIQAHVGGWIVEFTLTPEGVVTRFKTEWIPFYDLNFYRKWKYNM